jgi:hypothetical protein
MNENTVEDVNRVGRSTILFPRELQDVFMKNISSYLYIDHIDNLYWTCKDMKTQLDQSGNYIYKRICLHYQPHSVDDLPAIIESHGTQKWYKEGKLHRDGDLPAAISSDGDQQWYKEGEIHRDGDLPAIILSNGDQEWYKEGEIHRDDDLPAVIRSDGTQKWYKEGHEYRSAYPMMSNWLLLKIELPRLQAPDVASN